MKKLTDSAFNVFSQFGEDGIIQEIFQVIGISFKTCIEFGAWDGIHLSNTANLWKNGWKAILIESDKTKYGSLVKNCAQYDCYCINATVGTEGHGTIENILKSHNLSEDIDFISIDIDGDEYYVLESFKHFRPRVICCEYNPTIPPHIHLVPRTKNYFGCSALSLIGLAEKMAYKLISITDSNCFFVTASEFDKFRHYETSFHELAVTRHLTYLITGYDGSYILSREPTYGFSKPSALTFVGNYYVPSSSNRVSTLARSILTRITKCR